VSRVRYLQAFSAALADEMRDDPSVFMLGEDIRHSLRGLTRGMVDEFGPERVVDAPISEAGWTGFAIGAALAGRRPVCEFQIPSMLFIAFEQIVDQAAKLSLMTGGQVKVPVTFLVPGAGARLGLAAQHSDNPYVHFAHAGVKVVIPATADDIYGLSRAAIQDDDPVVVVAPNEVMGKRMELDLPGDVVQIGVGRIRRQGSDVTLCASGYLVDHALTLAETLAAEGVSVEVFDPRTVFPFDYPMLAESVAKTGRLVVLDDSNWTCGLAADVAANIGELCWRELKGPVRRVTRQDSPVPFAVGLEEAVLASPARAREEIMNAMSEAVVRDA
jgi:pyruvate/2-oxoglutarate/acetoin dehydrogenase E1 component